MKKIEVLNMIASGEAVGYVFNGMEFTSDINPLQIGSMVDTLNEEGYEPMLKEKQWYEEEEAIGKLCWFWQGEDEKNKEVGLFAGYDGKDNNSFLCLAFHTRYDAFENARPLTEAEAFALVYKPLTVGQGEAPFGEFAPVPGEKMTVSFGGSGGGSCLSGKQYHEDKQYAKYCREWLKGCGSCEKGHPEQCKECTDAFLDAVKKVGIK